MPDLVRSYNGGVVTARDVGRLAPGECAQLTGVYYTNGDPYGIQKIPGRSTFGDTGTGVKVDGLALCQFDDGADVLVALSNEDLFTATPGATGTFENTGLDVTGHTLDHAHFEDKHYLVTGDLMRVLESDGNLRFAGMQAPVEAPVAAAGTGGAVARPTVVAGAWVNPDNAIDANVSSFAHTTLAAAGTSRITVSGWAADAAAGRKLIVKWALTGSQWTREGRPDAGRLRDTGADSRPGSAVKVILEVSENDGNSWTKFQEYTLRSGFVQTQTQIAITGNSGVIQARATLEYLDGSSRVTLQTYDFRIQNAPSSSVFSTSGTGFLYAFREWDQTRGLPSPASPPSARVTLSSQNNVVLTLPAAAQNGEATHLQIYRTADGGEIVDLGMIGQVPVGSTEFMDDFTEYGRDEQPLDTIPLISVESQGGTPLLYARDQPPPILRKVGYHEGHLWGMTNFNRRELRYSVPGYPESWPEPFVYAAFPMEKHDELVDGVSLGRAGMILGCVGMMIYIDNFTVSTSGQLRLSNIFAISGAPGVVGDYAMTACEFNGETYCAWISYMGIYVTNGAEFVCISEDHDFAPYRNMDKSSFYLHWDEEWRTLIFGRPVQDSLGNAVEYLIHMDREHRKSTGQPLWTGPNPAKTTHMVSGQVENKHRRYAAHWSDGKVYLENDYTTGSDSSNAYPDSPGAVPLHIISRKAYEGRYDYEAHDAMLYHSNFGSGETATLRYRTGRDVSGDSGFVKVIEKTVSLNGQRSTQVGLMQSGEWHQEELLHLGTGSGKILDLTIRAMGKGLSGRQKV